MIRNSINYSGYEV